MKTAKKFLVTVAATAVFAAGLAAPAQAAKPGASPQASGICMIFPWWPFPC